MPGKSGSSRKQRVLRLTVLRPESDQYYEDGIGGLTDAAIAIHRNAREWGLTKVLNEAHAYRDHEGNLVVFLVSKEVVDA